MALVEDSMDTEMDISKTKELDITYLILEGGSVEAIKLLHDPDHTL